MKTNKEFFDKLVKIVEDGGVSAFAFMETLKRARSPVYKGVCGGSGMQPVLELLYSLVGLEPDDSRVSRLATQIRNLPDYNNPNLITYNFEQSNAIADKIEKLIQEQKGK
ncbi:MAG TPA: hypothetical protein PK717_04650 [Caldisericia bacterium]|nr:hypothetical protein [Caldisericia bacterium]